MTAYIVAIYATSSYSIAHNSNGKWKKGSRRHIHRVSHTQLAGYFRKIQTYTQKETKNREHKQKKRKKKKEEK